MTRIKILYVVNYFNYGGPCNVLMNIVKHIDYTKFEVRLITLFPEKGKSQINAFEQYGTHVYVPLKRWNVLLGNVKALKREIDKFHPNVIHATCVFAEYAVKCIYPEKELVTLHSFMKEDYIMGKGKAIGSVLCWMEKRVIKKAAVVVACGENLSRKYQQEMDIVIGYIRNGMDIDDRKAAKREEKLLLRRKLGLPSDKFIFVYSANFNQRKNHRFLLECIRKLQEKHLCFLFLGNGPTWQKLRETCQSTNVIFQGRVSDVRSFLRASDAYISVSKSEGMPMAVLEAMSEGLPVLLSDIPQHMEVLRLDERIGKSYISDDKQDLIRKIKEMGRCDLEKMGGFSKELVKNYFSAEKMSQEYQKKYLEISGDNKL